MSISTKKLYDDNEDIDSQSLEDANKGLFPIFLVMGIIILAVLVLLFACLFTAITDKTFGQSFIFSLKVWGGMAAVAGVSMLIGKIISLLIGQDLDDEGMAIGLVITIIIALLIIIF